MPMEKERLDVIKSMAYDLLKVIRGTPDKVYTVEELEKLIDAYIAGAQQ